jgi:uncharacterized protein YndB with AHSA1/START domain
MAVKFSQHVDIDAPPDTVWSLLSDVGKWPLWFPQMEQVTGLSGLQAGVNFQWRHGDESGTASILSVDEASDTIVVETRVGDDQHTHTFDVDRKGGFLGLGGNDSRVRYTLEYDPPGGMIGDFVAGGNPADALRVKGTLQKIRELAESMSGKR